MCLAIPAKVVRIMDGDVAQVEIGGITRQVLTTFVPELTIGDYVLLHAGFAIQTIDEADAQETLELLTIMAQEWEGDA
ncbi:HypC/HybG/HupF family hydrogenase formation chaperone [Chloroflexota bacterium]